jgi:hypothetical protein
MRRRPSTLRRPASRRRQPPHAPTACACTRMTSSSSACEATGSASLGERTGKHLGWNSCDGRQAGSGAIGQRRCCHDSRSARPRPGRVLRRQSHAARTVAAQPGSRWLSGTTTPAGSRRSARGGARARASRDAVSCGCNARDSRVAVLPLRRGCRHRRSTVPSGQRGPGHAIRQRARAGCWRSSCHRDVRLPGAPDAETVRSDAAGASSSRS